MKRKIIMDCDPGHDDAIALILAGAIDSPLEILAVTTVAGNQSVDKNTTNALNVLDIMGRQDIAVAKGADRPLIKPAAFASEIHGESGLISETTVDTITSSSCNASIRCDYKQSDDE